MNIRMVGVVSILLCLFSCNDKLQCERHFIPKDFKGKVTIYFDQKGGQRQFDKDGCIVYKISEKGECFSAIPYKEGVRYINKTFRYFAVITKDSIKEIPEFEKSEYIQDTINNQHKKYVFLAVLAIEIRTILLNIMLITA